MAYGDLPLDAPLKPNKGLEGGACNRQSCQADPALWYNHGMDKWYCSDCARDIGEDVVNKRLWELDMMMGEHDYPMFETREQIDARKVEDGVERLVELDEYELRHHVIPPVVYELQRRPTYSRYGVPRGGPYGDHPACKPKRQSSSLERLLSKGKKRR